jgi:hypothetical protein
MNKNLDEIVERWESTGLTQGSDSKRNLALCLQAQLQYNEQNDEDLTPLFKRTSIPLLRRMHEGECFKRNRFTNYFETEGHSKYKFFFKTKFTPPTTQNLDEEAEYVAELAKNLTKELNEAFKDKMNSEIIFEGFGLMFDPHTIVMCYS